MAPQKTKMKFSKILIASLVIISSLSLGSVKAEDTSVSCSVLVNSVVNIVLNTAAAVVVVTTVAVHTFEEGAFTPPQWCVSTP